MKSINNFSDTLIDEYDLFGKIFPDHSELQNSLADSVAEHFPGNGEGLVLLDMGAGYGFSTKLVAQRLPKASYILNDIAKELLDRSDSYLQEYKFKKLLGDIQEVIKTIPDASIDGVYTAWVLHNFPPAKRAIVYSEIRRILKPGGVFVVLEKIGNPGAARTAALAQAQIDLAPFMTKYHRPDLYLEWIHHNFRDEQPELLCSDDENKHLLESNGFTWRCIKHILLEKVIVAVKN